MNLKRAAVVAATCVLTIVVIMMIIGGCQEKPKVDPNAHITSEAVHASCTDPAEFHPISRMGFPIEALVVRHKNCLGIDDMFMVMWPGENSDKFRTAARLLMLMYVEFQNDQSTEEKMTADFIKVLPMDDRSHMAIYSLKTEKLLEKKETSEEVKL